MLSAESVEQGPEGTLDFEIQGGAFPRSDQLIAKTADLEGTLSVSLLAGSGIPAGRYFDLVVADSLLVGDLTLNAVGFDASFELVTITGGVNDGRQALRLLVVPEPAGVLLGASAAVAIARVRRRG